MNKKFVLVAVLLLVFNGVFTHPVLMVTTASSAARLTPAAQRQTPVLKPSDDPLNPPVSAETSASLLCLAVFLPTSLVLLLTWRKLRR